LKRVGILFNPKLAGVPELAAALGNLLKAEGHDHWACVTGDEKTAQGLLGGTEVLITVGGDGTILTVARLAVPRKIPILGVNMGKLGFMTEMRGEEALDRVPGYLDDEGWIEERALLDVEVVNGGTPGAHSWALNEVVVSRRAVARLISVEARIDGASLTTYKADGVIVATATGSTGYALAAGGPALHPESQELILVAAAPHISLATPLVVRPNAEIELHVIRDLDAVASLDGQIEYPLQEGEVVRVRRSEKVARFLRAEPRTYFYLALTERLSMRNNP
jgi:NAD+ kinase